MLVTAKSAAWLWGHDEEVDEREDGYLRQLP